MCVSFSPCAQEGRGYTPAASLHIELGMDGPLQISTQRHGEGLSAKPALAKIACLPAYGYDLTYAFIKPRFLELASFLQKNALLSDRLCFSVLLSRSRSHVHGCIHVCFFYTPKLSLPFLYFQWTILKEKDLAKRKNGLLLGLRFTKFTSHKTKQY